jgi:hypothetical protein
VVCQFHPTVSSVISHVLHSSSSLPWSSASVWVCLMAIPIAPMAHCLPRATCNGWRVRVPDYQIANSRSILRHFRMGVFKSHCSKVYIPIPTAYRTTSRMTSQTRLQSTNPALSVYYNGGWETCLLFIIINSVKNATKSGRLLSWGEVCRWFRSTHVVLDLARHCWIIWMNVEPAISDSPRAGALGELWAYNVPNVYAAYPQWDHTYCRDS